MRHSTYIVFAPPSKLQSLADRLNAPRGYNEDTYPDDGTNELGLGASIASSRAQDVGVNFATYHPKLADGSKHKRAIDFSKVNGLEKLSNNSEI